MGVQTALGTRCKVPHEGPDTNRRAIKIYLCVHFSPSLLTWVLRTGRATGKGKSLQAKDMGTYRTFLSEGTLPLVEE